VPAPTLEGYLFPDTYRVPFGSSAADVVNQMTARAHASWTEAYERRAREIGMSHHDVMTLASIVEAEARVADERPTIAAVYHNRLRTGMRLEADPTVAYAMGGYRGRLFYKDLAIESPYNTYRRTGLPPGPICNPGVQALRAAVNPTRTEFLYFVADNSGGHVFSRTFEEHLNAISAARRARDAAPQPPETEPPAAPLNGNHEAPPSP